MEIKYPITKKIDQVDTYHGIPVADPYRWLEDDNAADTKAWVQAQNEITFDYLAQIPFRQQIAERYADLFNYPKFSSPFKAGDYYFFYKNDGLQNQPVIYFQKGLEGKPDVFIDTNQLSEHGTISINLVGFSKDYGNSETNLVHFKNLFSYSPLHNLKNNHSYPATMITTADHDDRVVPAHSFKFCCPVTKIP